MPAKQVLLLEVVVPPLKRPIDLILLIDENDDRWSQEPCCWKMMTTEEEWQKKKERCNDEDEIDIDTFLQSVAVTNQINP